MIGPSPSRNHALVGVHPILALGLQIREALPGRTAGVFALVCLLGLVVAVALATVIDALWLLLIGVSAAIFLACAMSHPELFFIAYCAAIPLNFASPPGPAGTIARVAGVVFFVGFLLRRPDTLRLGTVPMVGWGFTIWALATGLWALNPDGALEGWISLAQLFAITVLIASIVSRDPSIVRPALWAYAISATATAGVAVIAFLQGATLFGRATAFPSQDPALFASLIVPAVVIFMGEIQSRSAGAAFRVLAVVLLAVCVIALALSGTRSAWVAVAAATVAWLIVQRDHRQVIAVLALAAAVVVLVASVPDAGPFLSGRLADSLSTGGSGRTDIWIVGLSIFASAPLLGFGFGNFGDSFTPYAISNTFAASGVDGVLFADRGAHNVLLAVTVETGLIGGLMFIAFVAAAFLRATDDRGYVVRIALLSLCVQAMFLDILAQKQLWLFLGLAFGLIASHRIAARTVPGEGASVPVSKTVPQAT